MIRSARVCVPFFMTDSREKGAPIYSRMRIIFARRRGRMRQKTKRQEASAQIERERKNYHSSFMMIIYIYIPN
jgi:hypothetical protein